MRVSLQRGKVGCDSLHLPIGLDILHLVRNHRKSLPRWTFSCFVHPNESSFAFECLSINRLYLIHFRTMITLSGATNYLPNDDRIYDGKDMSDIILNQNGGKSKHECYPMYGGSIFNRSADVNAKECPYNMTDPLNAACSGIWAIRCAIPGYSGSYKAHWVTRYVTGKIAVEDPPLLFNIDWDPSELHPISKSNVNYQPIMKYLTEKRQEALDSVVPVTNQMLLGMKSEYEICGAPNSKDKYPDYPDCTKTTEGFTGFTCDPVCYDEDNCQGGAPVAPGMGAVMLNDVGTEDGYSDDDLYSGIVTEVVVHYN